jgi:hypothetical protein
MPFGGALAAEEVAARDASSVSPSIHEPGL